MGDAPSLPGEAWPDVLAAAHAAALEFLQTLTKRAAGSAPIAPVPLALPAAAMGAPAALQLFRDRYEAGLSGSAGPRYLGFVTGGATPAALAGDWLVSAYDQNVSNDGDSLATFVELETLGMLRSLFGLPEQFHGAFVTGATQANVVGLATARQWAGERLGVDVAERGSYGLMPIPVLAGSAHASVLKAMSILGMGRQVLTPVATLPGRQAVDAHAMASALRALAGAPAIVVASAGDVNTGDFDDLAALADLCDAHGAWLHVDGAFGLFAACDRARAGWLAGLERADSVATDAHKWLNVPYDAGVVFTRHLALQEKVFRAVAAYLGAGPDLLHRTPENSRRFRALPSWMTLMAYGREGCTAVVQRCCALASDLGDRIQRSARLELLAPVRLNIVCFALRGGGAAERDGLLAALLDGGVVRLTPTVLHGRPALRAAFSNWRTTPADLDLIWAAIEGAAAQQPS